MVFYFLYLFRLFFLLWLLWINKYANDVTTIRRNKSKVLLGLIILLFLYYACLWYIVL
jgi:hypothetical protein